MFRYYHHQNYINSFLLSLLLTIIMFNSVVNFAQAEKTWPYDFDTTGQTSILSNLNENILYITSLPTNNKNLIIQNSNIGKISLTYSSSSSSNASKLQILNGTSSITITYNTIGAILFSKGDADTGAIQMNDQALLVIKNNKFFPDQFSYMSSSALSFEEYPI